MSRVDDMLPELTFKKGVDETDKLFGLHAKDKEVFLAMESQAFLADEALKNLTNDFTAYITEYDELQDMVSVQRAIRCIEAFGRLISTLNSEREFFIGVLSDYLQRAKNAEQEVESVQGISMEKMLRNFEIYFKYKYGTPYATLALEYKLTERQIRSIVEKCEDTYDKIFNKKNRATREIVKDGLDPVEEPEEQPPQITEPIKE